MNARQINAYLKRHNSPLAGYGNAFIRAGRQNGVSPALLVAISGAESSFGHINSGTNNPFGWGPGIDFPNYNAAISTIAKGLRQNYLNQGLKSIPQIASKWAPAGAGNDPTNLNSHWVENVKHFLSELGGASPMGPQAPVSAPNATAPTNTSSAPNLAQFALSQLPQIGKGYDPIKSLSDLTNMVAMGGGPSVGGAAAPSSSTPSYPAVSGHGITYSGQHLTHQTDGLPGYPAVDIFAAPGTAFLAPEDGKVIRWSGRGGTSGNVFGYSVYFQGKSGKVYFLTHLGPSRAAVGRTLRAGQRIGRVSPWRSGSPHVHVGIHG